MGNKGSLNKSVIILIAVTAAIVRIGMSSSSSSSTGSTRLQKMATPAFENLFHDPKVEVRFKGLDSQQSFNLAFELSSKGIRRLPAEDLLMRAKLILALLEGADEANCAALSKGDQKILMQALDKLPDDQLMSWINLAVKSARAEVDQMFYIPSTESEIKDGYTELVAKLSRQDQDTLRKTTTVPANLQSAKDVCQASRAILRSLPQLSSKSQEAVAREMVELK
jgi:hypothetical protein